jgi:hypothetical protein
MVDIEMIMIKSMIITLGFDIYSDDCIDNTTSTLPQIPTKSFTKKLGHPPATSHYLSALIAFRLGVLGTTHV